LSKIATDSRADLSQNCSLCL